MLQKIRSILKVFILIPIILWIFLLLVRQADPINRLHIADSDYEDNVISQSIDTTKSGEYRMFTEIELHPAQLDPENKIKFSLSLPHDRLKNQTDLAYPVLFIVGGLNDGRNYLNLMARHGNNVIIGFQYPHNRPFWDDQLEEGHMLSVRKNMLSVPHHVSHIINWMKQKEYIDSTRINFLGYSLGAIFAPSIIHYAERNGHTFKTSSIVYGAGDLDNLIATNLKIKPTWLRFPIAWTISSFIYPLEPNLYMNHISGDFLIINGELDKKIPISQALKFQDRFPDTKTVINIPEKHMHPKRRKLTDKLVRMTLSWLQEKNAIN